MNSISATAQAQLGRWPRAYVALLRWKHRRNRFRRRIVHGSTDITIEGYPRSGTSFAIRAFGMAQPDELVVASHAHHAAQVRRSVALGVPTLVVFRHPSRCIASLYALRQEVRDNGGAQPPLDIADSLRRYEAFHRQVLRVEKGLVLARFEDVTSDYGAVIERVNRQFGTNFVPFEHTEVNVQHLFRTQKSHLSPSQVRSADNARGSRLYAAADSELRARAENAFDATLTAYASQIEDRS